MFPIMVLSAAISYFLFNVLTFLKKWSISPLGTFQMCSVCPLWSRSNGIAEKDFMICLFLMCLLAFIMLCLSKSKWNLFLLGYCLCACMGMTSLNFMYSILFSLLKVTQRSLCNQSQTPPHHWAMKLFMTVPHCNNVPIYGGLTQ